jgi:hypothetical protein
MIGQGQYSRLPHETLAAAANPTITPKPNENLDDYDPNILDEKC